MQLPVLTILLMARVGEAASCTSIAAELAGLPDTPARSARVSQYLAEEPSDTDRLARLLGGLPGAPPVAEGNEASERYFLSLCEGSAASTPPPSPQALRDYQRRRLYRAATTSITTTAVPISSGTYTTYVPITNTVNSWGVFDGGSLLLLEDFARRTGDTAGTDRADAWLATSQHRARVTTGVGVGLGLAGLVALVSTANAEEPSAGAVLFGALGVSTAVVVVPMGITLTVVAPRARKRASVSRFYAPDEADALIERHNAALRAELGLSEADTLEMDLKVR